MIKYKRKKNIRSLAGLLLGVMLAAGLTCSSYAAIGPTYTGPEKPDDMTDEYWENLSDYTIEWAEIEDLIKYKNPTYAIYNNQVDESVSDLRAAASEDSKTLKESLNEIADTIASLRKSQKQLAAAGDTSSAAYQLLDASLATAIAGRSTIDTSLDSMGTVFRSLNYTSDNIDNTLSSLRYPLLQAVEGLVISYKTLEVNRELLGKQYELYSSLYTTYSNMLSQNMATQTEVDSYRIQAESALDSLELVDNSMAQIKRNILQQCGYDPDDDVTIADLPEPDRDYLKDRDYEADLERAVNSSSAVRNADVVANYSDDVLKYRDASVAAAQAQASVSMHELYTAIESQILLCDSTDTAEEIAAIQARAADTEQELGMLSKGEYESLKLQYLASQATASLNRLNLQQAIENYRFALLGYL